MDHERKRRIIKGALLVAMAGITLAEAEAARADPVAKIKILPGSGLEPFTDLDGGPTWSEFIKHDPVPQGLNVSQVINVWPGAATAATR